MASEPATQGKVILKTSLGDVAIELWCKEAPKTCRNFLQLCVDGFYSNSLFHRIVKGTFIQGVERIENVNNEDGSNVFAEDYCIFPDGLKPEYHSRLRFSHRGIVAMADRHNQFFVTFNKCEWLNNKHTVFGKVVGETMFNIVKADLLEITANNDRPLVPPRIIAAEVCWNPFEDMVPSTKVALKSLEKDKAKKPTEANVTLPSKPNKKLLSFQDNQDDGDDDDDDNNNNNNNSGKSKQNTQQKVKITSIHDKITPKTQSTNDIKIDDNQKRDKISQTTTTTTTTTPVSIKEETKAVKVSNVPNEIKQKEQKDNSKKINDINNNINNNNDSKALTPTTTITTTVTKTTNNTPATNINAAASSNPNNNNNNNNNNNKLSILEEQRLKYAKRQRNTAATDEERQAQSVHKMLAFKKQLISSGKDKTDWKNHKLDFTKTDELQ